MTLRQGLLRGGSITLPLAMLMAHPIAAQTVVEDEVIVTGQVSTFGATKSDIPILETSRSVSVINAEEYTERGALTLDDTLNYTAGVVGDPYGFSTRGDFPSVRGLDIPEYLDNIQVLFGNYNNARSDLYTLEQVEVLKGPASVLYGQGSPGGVLNTVSKKAGADYLGREIVLEGGTYDRFQISTDLGFDLSGDGVLTGRLVGLLRESETQVDYVNDDSLVIAPSITYDNGRTVLTALLNYTNRESNTAGQFLPIVATGCADNSVTFSEPALCTGFGAKHVDVSTYVGSDNFDTYDTTSTSFTVFGTHQINDIFSLEGTARYRDNEADYKQTWISFLGAGTPRIAADGSTIGKSWYDSPAGSTQFSLDSRVRAKFDTGTVSHEVLAGYNYQDVETTQNAAFLYGLPSTHNIFTDSFDADPIPTQAVFDAARARSDGATQTQGIYINDQIEVGNFVLNAGIRYDELDNEQISQTGPGAVVTTVTQDDSQTSLSFGALYKTGIGLNPYISYSESFQAVIGGDQTTGNPLKPQIGKQTEIGVKYQPSGSRTYITAAYFDIEQSNLANPQGLPTAPSQQEGIAKVKGFEIEAQTVIGDFYLDGNFSALDTEDVNGNPFSSIPETQASSWVTWRPSTDQLDGLRIGGGVRYTSESQSSGTSFIAANGFAATPLTIVTDGNTLVDAMIGYEFNKVDLSLNARNLLNKEYYGSCLARGDCFPGEKRTVMARAAYRF